MKLKTCRNIECILNVLRWFVLVPLFPLSIIGMICVGIWCWVQDLMYDGIIDFSNKLACNCDEVKNGIITDERYKRLTSINLYNWYRNGGGKNSNKVR